DGDETLQLEPRADELPGGQGPRHRESLGLRPLQMLPFLQPRRPRLPREQCRQRAMEPGQLVMTLDKGNQPTRTLCECPPSDRPALLLMQLVRNSFGHNSLGPVLAGET